MASHKDLAIMSHLVYDDGEISSAEWKVDGEIIKLVTGFQAAVYIHRKTGEKVISYCGSNNIMTDPVDQDVDDRLIKEFDRIPPQSISAMMLFEMVISGIEGVNKEKYFQFFEEQRKFFVGDIYKWQERDADEKKPNIMVTGHSLGGSLAAIVANKYGTRAVVFEPLAFVGLTNDYDITSLYGFIRYLNGEYDKNRRLIREYLKEVKPEWLHVMDIIDIYEGKNTDVYNGLSMETKKSPIIDKDLVSFVIPEDMWKSKPSNAGKFFYAAKDSNLSYSEHKIIQWSKGDRYDVNGNFDPTKKINKSLGERALVNPGAGIDWEGWSSEPDIGD